METSELRKSNVIIFDTSIVQVSGTLNYTVFVENGGTIDELPAAYCSGIPLTEELLLKFGFEKQNLDDSYWFELKTTYISLISNDSYFNEGKDIWHIGFSIYGNDAEYLDQRIQYVHQTQNLYFALTGEELTLSPQK